eukprot:scaffold258496_cov15-Tisochrysis_lutea.AAC.1
MGWEREECIEGSRENRWGVGARKWRERAEERERERDGDERRGETSRHRNVQPRRERRKLKGEGSLTDEGRPTKSNVTPADINENAGAFWGEGRRRTVWRQTARRSKV